MPDVIVPTDEKGNIDFDGNTPIWKKLIVLDLDALSIHSLNSIVGDYCAMRDLGYIDRDEGTKIVETCERMIKVIGEKHRV